MDQFNSEIDSHEILKNNQILLLFYRGNWCPYCRKHLMSLQENLEELIKKGIYVIVVTPEKIEKIQETSKKLRASFSIVHDANNKIMNDYNVAFEVNEQNVPNYLQSTLDKIREYNETNNNVLPVPATYIIGKNRKISYVHFDPTYSNRASFAEIITILK